MQITLGKMRKRPNSTKRTLSASTNVTVTLKENVTVENPIFILNTDPSDYNYVVWGDKYYYIDCNNVRILANNLWEVPCNMDVLATFRDTIRYGIRGVMSYSTKESDWDVYADDYRFNPTYISNNSSAYPDLSTGASKHTNSNIFGLDSSTHKPKLWDVTFSNSGSPDYVPHATAFGSGMYVLTTFSWSTAIHENPVAGKRIYLIDEYAFEVILGNSKFKSVITGDNSKYILSLMWMPIKLSELITHLSGRYSTASVVYIGDDDFPISTGAAYLMNTNPCTVSFNNQLAFPDITGGNDEEYPVFYQNNRWSSMKLITPSGTYEINLDSIYPYSWDGRRLSFSTMFDILNGTVNVKYTIDNKPNQGYLDSVAPVIYESNISIGLDVLSSITSDPNSGVITNTLNKMGQASATLASGIGLAAGIATGAAPLAAIAPSAISGVGSAIALSSGLLPEANNSVLNTNSTNITSTGTFLSLINSVQIGMITLRLKTYTCNEIEQGDAISGRYAIDKYKSYCTLHGYPVNKMINNQTNQALDNRLIIFRNPIIVPAENAMPDGMSRDDVLYILNILQTSGVWLEQ